MVYLLPDSVARMPPQGPGGGRSSDGRRPDPRSAMLKDLRYTLL